MHIFSKSMHNFALFYFYSIAQTVDYVKVCPLFSKIFRLKAAKLKDFQINISKHICFFAPNQGFPEPCRMFLCLKRTNVCFYFAPIPLFLWQKERKEDFFQSPLEKMPQKWYNMLTIYIVLKTHIFPFLLFPNGIKHIQHNIIF